MFDGIHLAHQALIEQATTVLTFHPHPNNVLGKTPVLHLTTVPEQRHFIPNLIALEFNQTIANLTWNEFLDDIIWDHFKPDSIITGYDYKFGKHRAGTIEKLTEWCDDKGIKVKTIEPITRSGTLIKSTEIRRLLTENEFDNAIDLLGHPYPIFGRVIKGEGRGKTLGFPTANIALYATKCRPSNGVYGGYWLNNDHHIPCIIYIGTKPTFTDSPPQVEAHIPNFSGNLYNQTLQLFLTHHIRSEMTFDDATALKTQIQLDIDKMMAGI